MLWPSLKRRVEEEAGTCPEGNLLHHLPLCRMGRSCKQGQHSLRGRDVLGWVCKFLSLDLYLQYPFVCLSFPIENRLLILSPHMSNVAASPLDQSE